MKFAFSIIHRHMREWERLSQSIYMSIIAHEKGINYRQPKFLSSSLRHKHTHRNFSNQLYVAISMAHDNFKM